MPITVQSPRGEAGVDSLYDTQEKVFEDIRANPGEKAFVFIHSVPFEGSVSLGNLAGNRQIETLLKEGATVYACRFAMGALYGFREEDLIDGVKAFNPLDVLDSALTAWRAGAFQLNTWTVLPRLRLAGAGPGDRPW